MLKKGDLAGYRMRMIFARERELAQLETIFVRKEASFLAVYGRRRIGKTYLVNEFFSAKDCFYFQTTGVVGASKQEQLRNFSPTWNCREWGEAFHRLWLEIDALPKKQKVVVFLDELPWLASARSGFLPALDFFWNHWLSRRRNSTLIVCGSAAALDDPEGD